MKNDKKLVICHGFDSEEVDFGLLLDVTPNEIQDQKHTVVGKLIYDRNLKASIIMSSLRNVQLSFRKAVFNPSGSIRYLVSFNLAIMMRRVLVEDPQTATGNVFVLKEQSGKQNINEVELDEVAFWVQVHGVKLDQMTENNAKLIGLSLGKLVEVEPIKSVKGLRRGFLRIKMLINVTKPLKKKSVPIESWVKDIRWALNMRNLLTFASHEVNLDMQ